MLATLVMQLPRPPREDQSPLRVGRALVKPGRRDDPVPLSRRTDQARHELLGARDVGVKYLAKLVFLIQARPAQPQNLRIGQPISVLPGAAR